MVRTMLSAVTTAQFLYLAVAPRDRASNTSTPRSGRRRATRIDAPVQDGRDSAVGEEPGPRRSLSSRGAGAAQAT